MKFDILFRSKTDHLDYRWFRRPSYLDESLDTKLRPLFLMAESAHYKRFFSGDEKDFNFYFIVEKEYCALCYVHIYATDEVGRGVYALEGLCCPREECLRLWNYLPKIIVYLIYKNVSGHSLAVNYQKDFTTSPAQWELPDSEKSIGNENAVSEFYQWLETRFNKEDFVEPLKDVAQDVFANLICEMKSANEIYSFVLGTREASFYPLQIEKIYRMGEMKKKFAPVPEKLVKFENSDICDTEIFFGRSNIKTAKDMRYQISVLAFDKNKKIILNYENAAYFDKYGVPLTVMRGIEKAVELALTKRGYYIGNEKKIKPNKSVKYQFSYRDVKIPEKQLVFKRIHCILDHWNQHAEEFADEEQQLIRQLFQYSIRNDCYENGKEPETVYVLNLKSGLWVFTFALERKDDGRKQSKKEKLQYVLHGIFIENTMKNQAWMHMHSLMTKEILAGRNVSADFTVAYQEYQKKMNGVLHPVSAVITSFPKEYFPNIPNLDVYTIASDSNVTCVKPREKEVEISEEGEAWLSKYSIMPPTLFQKNWYLEMKTKSVFGKKEYSLTCIEEDSCNLQILHEALQKGIDVLNY